MKYNFFHCFFWVLVALNSCPVLGQDSLKKQITEADYEKWGDLKVNSISDNGKWCSYTMVYDNHKDTLFVQHTSGRNTHTFPKGREGRFFGNAFFAFLVGDTMQIIGLETQTRFALKGVARYEIVNNGKFVLSYKNNKSLEIRKADGKMIESITDVMEYKTNDAGTALVYVRKIAGIYEVGYTKFEDGHPKILVTDVAAYGRFNWQADGKSVVFANDNVVNCYRFTDQRLFTFEIKSVAGYSGSVMAKGGFTNLTVSDDGTKVFFSIIQPAADQTISRDQGVEVWNGNDTCLFPAKQVLRSAGIPKLAVWFPQSGRCSVLSDTSRFNARLTSGGDYVLLSDPYTYVLASQYPKRMDYYLKDVRTGAETLLLEQHPEEINQLSFSPLHNSILYYQNKDWWLYNPVSDLKTKITKNLNHSWDSADDDNSVYSGAHGVAAWTDDGKYVLLYDQYDIWKAALDGSACIRLTKGREKNLIYRLSKAAFEGVKFRGYESGLRKVITLYTDIILEVTSTLDWSTGYTLYSEKYGLRSIVYGQKKYSGIQRSANGIYLFANETFSQPPQVEFWSHQQTKTVFHSNRHQEQYQYGRSELIHYKNSYGEELKGALFYPAGYKEGEKYPMVVKIYERLSGMLHKYVRPSLANDTGFNTSVFTTNGYFVFFPDIQHSKGNPGISANDCVTAAIKEVVGTHPIDQRHIGLIGHSFGGYETDFIITQTNLFAAAVSGAGVGNTIGHYFGLDVNGGLAADSMWKYESQQFRMGIPFYEDKQAYLNNSPLYNADSITTPLLQWCGKNDVVVPYEQSVNLYLALRKLRFKTILLAYPDEGHSFNKEANQQDLSRRILQWFDYHLKGRRNIGWITVGISDE